MNPTQHDQESPMTSETARREVPTASLSLHPDAAIVPEISSAQFDALLADVRVRGVLKPIELIAGTTTVIDGRTRLRAATEAELASVPVVDVDLAGEPPVLYMLRAAVLRRHLTRDQLAIIAVEIEEHLAIAAKERQREGARRGGVLAGRGRPLERTDDSEEQSQRSPRRSRDEAAAIVRTNPKAVGHAKRLKREAPGQFGQVKAGLIKLSRAITMLKPAPVGRTTAAEAVVGEPVRPELSGVEESLLKNLEFAVWCFENPGMGPTPDALANMKAAIALAKSEVV